MSRAPDGFLARWSRAKRGEGAEEADPVPEAPPAEDTRTDAEILEDLGLTDPDALQPGDDFSAFLRDAVPEHLRRRALRRLWRSNPVLANLDGLNDYDTDFRGDSVAPGLLKTAYKVGLGFAQQTPDATETPPAEGAEPAGPVPPETADAPAKADEVSEIAAQPGTEDRIMQDYAEAPARRRMQFRFEPPAGAPRAPEDFLEKE